MSILIFLLLASSARAEPQILELCNVRIESVNKLDFSQTEQKWLCGDAATEGWKSIPLSQQRLFLRAFLQSRGYQKPSFAEAGNQLIVQAGPVFPVQKFTINGAPPEFNESKRRKLLGAPLMPRTLDQTVSWAKRQLQFVGYPCPQVSAKAALEEGELLLDVKAGPRQWLGPVQDQGASDLDPRILERFTAFVPGQPFDLRLLELTSDRILQEDLYLSTFYDVACNADQIATVTRRFVPAAPRLLTFGLGFDTERGPIIRGRAKRVRLSSKANSLEASTFLSLREQKLEAKFRDHFPADPGSRLEFAPRLSVTRLDETNFETVTTQLEPAFTHSWEKESFRLSARAGPLLERTDTHRGPGTRHLNAIRFVGQISAMSHLFEYYLGDPSSGWQVELESSSQFAGLGSRQTIQRLLLRQEALWNLGHFDPPLFVLGWRGWAGSFFFRQEEVFPHDIPVNERYFLGGDEDIRGFGRKKLPGNEKGKGYLTALYQGLELRVVDWLPWKLQPFVFFDIARGGMRVQHLDSPFFYAPGLGLRWASPVGTLRASLARGFSSRQDPEDPEPNLQFFVSFGKEF